MAMGHDQSKPLGNPPSYLCTRIQHKYSSTRQDIFSLEKRQEKKNKSNVKLSHRNLAIQSFSRNIIPFATGTVTLTLHNSQQK